MENLNKLQQTLMILRNIYDDIRVINPISKRILFDKDYNSINEGYCYEFSGNEGPCSNCVGMRAFNEGRSFIKLYFNGEDIVLHTAMPFVMGEEKYIIEAYKVMDDTSFIDGIEFNCKEDLKQYVENINNAAIRDEKTEVFNSRFAHERLPAEIELSKTSNACISIALLEIKFAHEYENENVRDYNIFNIISIVANELDKRTDWISRIEENKFIILIKRENDNLCSEDYMRIIMELERKSTLYNGTNFMLGILVNQRVLSDMVYDAKQLIEYIMKNVKRTYE
ncbi:MAG: hypothetical protein Q8930_03615 [Bacillota bacterium]|nr:hypothetical protein [Bacillota bacterium]